MAPPIIDPTATVGERAVIEQDAWVGQGARIRLGARIGQGAVIEKDARIRQGAVIEQGAWVGQGARIEPDARVHAGDIILIGPLGTRNAMLTVNRRTGRVVTGCFSGCVDELEIAAREKGRQDYIDALPAIRALIRREEVA